MVARGTSGMSSKVKIDPPALNDGDDYDEWAREVKIWQLVTDIAKAKQGALVYLSLQGKARECCKSIEIEKLQGDHGIDILLDKLKELFAKDSEQAAFMAYEKFETYIRPKDVDMNDFINEWERRYGKIKEKAMELPDGVLAYRLLKSANIDSIKQTMVRSSIAKLSLDEVKKQLKAVHDNTVQSSSTATDVAIKLENTYFCEDGHMNKDEEYNTLYTYSSRGRGRFHGKDSKGYYIANRAGYRGRGIARGKTNDKMNKSSDGGSKKGHKLNPADAAGNPRQCVICKSIMHFVKDCPHNDDEEEEITLFSNGVQDQYMSTFLSETFNSAILDSGCSKTVCGRIWYQQYCDSISEKDVQSIEEMEGTSKFKFGNGESFQSLKKVRLPAKIGSKSVQIETDVVEAEIPMLLSKVSMKKANAKLDFVQDSVDIFGESLKLNFTTSGHYMIDLNPKEIDLTELEENLTLFSIQNASQQDKERMAAKLHTQFGHARSDRIVQLVKDAGIEDKEFELKLREIGESCEVCQRYKKTKPRPVVGFALARDFNEVVSVDLKEIDGDKVFHIIDNATRYSGGSFIKNKTKETIVGKFLKHWVRPFGCPGKLLSDNGREFNNDLFRELASLLNVELLSTAAESPWSNGITERHNALLEEMVKKVIEETGCTKEIALSWCLAAKNSLKNVYGFGPNQLVFGKNPNMPSLCEGNLASLQGKTSSQVIAENLNAMHAARKAFIENEASDKLRRALLSKTRTSTSLVYEIGDKVFYKRKSNDKWLGPASVIGSENKQVFVKHGGEYYRVSPIHLQHVNERECLSKENGQDLNESTSNDDFNYSSQNNICAVESSDEDSTAGDEQNESENVEVPEVHTSTEDTLLKERISETLPGDNETGSEEENPTIKDGIMPSKGSKIMYKRPECENWESATVLGRSGTARGRNKWWSNIRSENETLSSLNMEELDAWKYVDEEVLLACDDSSDVLMAKMKELNNLKLHKVYEQVEDSDVNKIETTWIITESWKKGIKETKARLVARGFQEKQIQQRKDSPTCLKASLRLIFCIAATEKWSVKILDIKSAFLQGQPIQRDVFLKPPKEAGETGIWKLKKTIYGLSDASRQWYLTVKNCLETCESKMSLYDEALFYYTDNGTLKGIIALHVDDFFYCGNQTFHNNVIEPLKKEYEISKEAERKFSYIGLEIQQNDNEILLNQDKYIDELQMIDVKGLNDKRELISGKKSEELRSLIGKLLWVSGQTRPDIAFEVCQLSVNFNKATVEDLKKANKCVKKLQLQKVVLRFPNLGDLSKLRLLSYTDSSFNNLGEGASQGAFINFVVGENQKYAPLSWQSKKLQRVVKSTLGAETMALMSGVENAMLFAAMIQEVSGSKITQIVARTDSKSLYDAANSSKTMEDSRLKIDVAVLRDYLRQDELQSIDWVPSDEQLADSLTKGGASTEKLLCALRGDFPMHS